ncbi:hypothetical protein N5C81_15070 [Rhizobium pusense]|uniref:hypothetical protein n=1 Tax=Agrobacterium pusense TaxID=648995 RepID=UPI0024473DCE|nr:hypothetical protein [Agrobacterium pusense]MDH1268945.1 hypothetical protein [Agrobacterium pusense]
MARTHKECAPNEEFVGNTYRSKNNLDWLKSKGLTSVRLGNQAFSIDGEKLPESYAPVIIARDQAELYNAIMMEKTFGPNWRRA